MAVDLIKIEQRLSTVETALNRVQQKLGLGPAPANWVDEVAGSLADIPDDDYQKFLDCCRAVRNGVDISDAEETRP
jgi:hypothetical protein